MQNFELKKIGTVENSEIKNLSTIIPWEEVATTHAPFTSITSPSGFLFTQGSACGSLPTTSILGWEYVADFYLYRKDGTAIDRDRYLGSVTPEGKIAVLLVSKALTPFHHISLGDVPLQCLPEQFLVQVTNVLGTVQK